MIANKIGSVEINKSSFFCGFSSNKFGSVEINKSTFPVVSSNKFGSVEVNKSNFSRGYIKDCKPIQIG
jgi:hypothetical protein